jgi:RNA polymerase sigma factor (sigma-70 family)
MAQISTSLGDNSSDRVSRLTVSRTQRIRQDEERAHLITLRLRFAHVSLRISPKANRMRRKPCSSVSLSGEKQTEGVDDRILISRFKQTKAAEPFEILFERYGKRLYCVAYDIYRNTDLAEDCVQETFRRAIQQIDRFGEGEGEHNFWAWLATIARDFCLSDLRRRQTQMKYVERSALADSRRTPISPEQKMMVSELVSFLRSLPEQYRTCYLLFFVEGCTYREITNITGYTQEQVKTYIQTARRRIHHRFRDASNPGEIARRSTVEFSIAARRF